MRLTARALALLAAGWLLAACQHANPPVVKGQTLSAQAGSMQRVAIVPFSARPELALVDASGESIDVEAIADLVSTFVGEAIARRGVHVIPASDVGLVFLNQGRAIPRRDPRAAAATAQSEFGATSVVMGQVIRWRERKGEAYGADSPASVAYELSLHAAPGGRRLFTTRFDHTQRTLTADPLTARKYPGGGTRFLTAAELARWGAQAAADALVEGQWRASK